AKDFSGARSKLESATKADAKDPIAAYYMGRLEMDESHADKAAEWFDRAVDLDPANAIYMMWQGRAYGNQAQKANIFSKARLARKTKNAWDKAEKLDPNN